MNRKIIVAFMAVAFLMSSAVAAFSNDQDAEVTAGAVYTMTNAADGNQLVVFARGGDGLLTMAGAIPTEGLGSGGGLDPLASQGAIVLTEDHRWLLAVNAGSNEISVFRIMWDGPVLVGKVDSGGEFPVSLTVFHDLVYVLNAGGTANITGFYLGYQGQLTLRSNSTRDLGSGGFAQVGFDPQGNNLVVTDRDENEILVFPLNRHGLPAIHPVTSMSIGLAPFGFVFDEKGHLLVSEAGSGAVSSYAINRNGSLQVISPSIANGQAATCWIARNQRGYVFTANTGSQNLSLYEEERNNGRLDLLDATAGFGNRPIDMDVSVNGRFLYALDPASETIDMFKIESDGSLTDLGTVAGGLSIFAQGLAVR
ncbi:MAG: beta-propeller fold lactonase family protein [Nitrospirota bacterium]